MTTSKHRSSRRINRPATPATAKFGAYRPGSRGRKDDPNSLSGKLRSMIEQLPVGSAVTVQTMFDLAIKSGIKPCPNLTNSVRRAIASSVERGVVMHNGNGTVVRVADKREVTKTAEPPAATQKDEFRLDIAMLRDRLAIVGTIVKNLHTMMSGFRQELAEIRSELKKVNERVGPGNVPFMTRKPK